MKELETKIGYDRIRQAVEANCTTAGGRQKFAAEQYTSDAKEVWRRLTLADQMRRMLMMESGFPGGEYTDVFGVLRKLEVEGAFLETEEIMALRAALTSVRDLLEFIKKREEGRYPELAGLTRGVSGYPEIINHIESIFDRFGNVRDNASPELYEIRRAIRDMEGQISKRLRQVLAEAQAAGYVDSDATISIRDGRAVIPVTAANKRKVKGFVQDESATGKTVYIEPVEVVEINNELRDLEYRERREIVRILTVFTETVRADAPGIEQSNDFLTTVDMLRAKARYTAAKNCVRPILSDEGTLELRKARHPLLEDSLAREGKQIVPLDLVLTRSKHILVISGPNAGGKSVCLKTVGLLQWMLQCGMPVPCLENSQFPLFDNIFIDIGDEQSIDNDLSTYSSHLMNMKRMLQGAGNRSLILIDEFGTGTEPVIGGAIAESILEKLEARGCYGVITTHYSNIKYYASRAEGVANGAMRFDVQNIRPLFSLEMGTPGSSFAIEIARKIGLPEDIIRSASDKAGTDHVNIEKQLREIARDKRYWEQKRDRIRIADRKVEDLEQKYSDQLAAMREMRADIIREAKAEAQRITDEANKTIENAIRTIRESQADKEQTLIVRRRIDDLREEVTATVPLTDEKIEKEMQKLMERRQRREERKAKRGESAPTAGENADPLLKTPVVGSKVRIEGQDTIGEVQQIKGKKATVAFGQILTTVDLSRLEVVSNSEFKRQGRSARPSTINVSEDVNRRKLAFKRSIDVRGMRAAEALEAVEDFIDDAVMVGASSLTILHGKGTGALKEEIRRYLRSTGIVRSAEDEHVDRGGAGITVVELDM